MKEKESLLLMFAYHFPPENAIGGVRPYRYSKYLARLGVRTHTFTNADVSARADLDAETVVDPFIARPRRGMGWQIERAIRKFLLPGASGSQWALSAYKAACRFLDTQEEERKTAVFSTFPPLGTPLAGYWLARRRGLPWILDFRDPLADSPSDDFKGYQRALCRYLERKFVAAADCVIANTDAAEARLKKAYPQMAWKITLLWNGFDPEQRLGPLPMPDRAQRIYSHIGELYEGRVITPLLLAIGRLIDAGKVSPAQILIHLVGPIRGTSVPSAEFMATAQQKGWLRLTAQVPQAEAQRLMQESDGLLLVQPHSTVQVPGKLFEYVQVGRPVFAYILRDTPIERILKKSGTPFICGYASEPEGTLDDALGRYFAMDSNPVPPSDWFETGFNAQKHAEQLLNLIQGVSAKSNGR